MRIRLHNLTTRLSLLSAALVLSAIGIGGAAFWTVAQWGGVMDELTAGYAQALEAEQLRGDVSRLAKELTEILLRDENAPRDLAAIQASVQAHVAALRARSRSPAEARLLERVEGVHGRVAPLAGRVLAMVERGELGAAFGLSEAEIEKRLLPELNGALGGLRMHYLRDQRAALERADGAYTGAVVFAGVIAALALLQLGGFFVFLHRGFQRPVEVIRAGTERMRGGDLAHRIDLTRDDELGRLAANINTMARSLRESRERLVQSERLAAVGEVAAYLAHNLRNPLAGIRSAAQAGLEEVEDAAASRETFQDTIATVDRLSGWVEHILRYVSPTPVQPGTSDPRELLEAGAALVAAALAERRVRLRVSAPGLPMAPLDLPAMEQALSAVLLNAVEASAPGGEIELAAERVLPGDGAPARLRIRVCDRGPGMTPEALREALKPFSSDKPQGTGLGLPMAVKVARAHGGELHVESHAQGAARGTTVTFDLPG